MAALDWDNFSAFHAPGALDRDILRQTLRLDGSLDTNADVGRFYIWLNQLRDHTQQCGIPDARVDDVVRLLNTFFPDGRHTPAGRLAPIQISDMQPLPPSTLRTAVPITVRFGSQNAEMDIIDASSALGYIFSVVTPSVENPTWQTYFLPLLAIFSRCQYLAFIAPGPTAGVPTEDVNNVPVMSCVMYVPGHDPLPLMYGSTWSAGTVNVGLAEALINARKIMIDQWRRQHFLDPALPFIPVPAGAPVPTIPLSPRYLEELEIEFSKDCLGTGRSGRGPLIPTDQANQISQPLATQFVAALLNSSGVFTRDLPRERLAGSRQVGGQMMQLIGNILQLRLAPGYVRTPAVQVALEAFFGFLYIPHMFPATRPPPVGVIIPGSAEQPVGELPGMAAVIDATVTGLWATFGAAALNRLDDFNTSLINNVYPPRTPFGRCCETYPLVGMLPHYQAASSMPDVHGMAMHNMYIGQSRQFQTHFHSDGVDASGPQGPYRFPCENCKVLLPVYKVRYDTAHVHYDADIVAIPPLPQVNPPRD